jgi:low temperature requirement protein LtrA
MHFPLMCGLIIYAYAIEEAMTHPNQEMTLAARIALSLGIFIYSMGIGLTHFRATGQILFSRLIFTIIIAGSIYFINGIATFWTLAIALVGLIILCFIEELYPPFGAKMEEGIEID